MARTKQLRFLKFEKSAYGGELQKRRAGRAHGRPLSTRETTHLILRSTQAKGVWSMLHKRNNSAVRAILKKFARKYGVRVVSMANVGNHLHLQIKLANRYTYNSFIRAVTGGIAMAITGRSRWSRMEAAGAKKKFWDYRPFTKIVRSFAAYRNLQSYVRLNELESLGFSKTEARQMLEVERILSG